MLAFFYVSAFVVGAWAPFVWAHREVHGAVNPAHVALTILRRLDARDLCALRATCRAFDAALVETAAFEATRARAVARRAAPPRPRRGTTF